ncbi:glycerophosphodiester phosphodiesterase [Aquirufa sp. ROCK-SH2]
MKNHYSTYLIIFLLTLSNIGFGQSNIQISAHRGNSGLAPENTLATFQKVLELGVDYIEIDVRTSADNQLVILHDGTLNRTSNGIGPIALLTLAEIKNLRANKGWEQAFPEEKIPTLEETAQLISNWNKNHSKKTYIYVDCKQVAATPLVEMLQKYDLAKHSIFYGSDDFLAQLKTVFPASKRMPSLRSEAEIDTKISRLEPYAFDVSWNIVNEQLVQKIHDKKVKVFSDILGPLDNPTNYHKAIEWKLDLIQTDHVRGKR